MSYWLVALALVAFGVLGALSIGAPFLFVGAAMVVLGPFRRRRVIFVPAMLGIIGLAVTTSILVPFSCTATSTSNGDALTVCTSLVGLTWSGPGLYNPPPEAFEVATLIGLAVGGTTAILSAAWLLLGRRTPRSSSGDIR